MTQLQKSKNNKRDPKGNHSKTCSSHENSIYTSVKMEDFSIIMKSPAKIQSGTDINQINNLKLLNTQRSDFALQINRLQGNRYLQEYISSSNNNNLNTLQKQTNTQSSNQIPPAVTKNPNSGTDNKSTEDFFEQLYNVDIGSDSFQGVTKAQAIRLLWKHYHRLSGWVVAEKGGHLRLIAINKKHWIVAAVANELGGRINAVQPPISNWNWPQTQLADAKSKLSAGNVEGGLDSLLQAERLYSVCHKLYYMWKNGTIEGAERVVTTLKVTAVVGAVAATIATGGMAAAAKAGLAGVSLAAGGGAGWYGMFSEAGKQAMEGGIGMREEADIKAILKRGATDFVTAFVGAFTGGLLSKVALKIFQPLIKRIGDNALGAIGQRLKLSVLKVRELLENYISDFVGGAASAPFTTAVQAAMARINDPRSAPKTAGEFFSLVKQELITGGIIQIFLGAFMHTYGVKTSSGKPMSPADIGVTQPVPEAVAPTLKAPPRGTTTEPAPSFEHAPTIKAPPRGTTTEPPPSFESAPTVKAPPRGTTTEPPPSFESAPTVKAPPRGTTTEPPPSFEHAPTIKAPPRGTTTEPLRPSEGPPTIKETRGTTTEPFGPSEGPPTIKDIPTRKVELGPHETAPPEVRKTIKVYDHENKRMVVKSHKAVNPRARQLNPADFDERIIKEGVNKGKKLLTHKKTGKEYLFKPEAGEAPALIGTDEGIYKGERYRRVPAAAEVGKRLGFDTPGGEVVRYGEDLGSLQEWIRQGRTLESYGTSKSRAEVDIYHEIKNSQLKKDMDVFDYLIANMDRNPGNLKVIVDPVTGKVARLIPIDMDIAFPPSEVRFSPYLLELKTLPAHHVPVQKPLPNKMTSSLHRNLTHMKNNRSRLENVLQKFLTDKEIEGMFKRLDEILSKVASKEITIV